MPFLLQRKWTLPQKKQHEEKPKIVNWNLEGKNSSFWSIPENQKQNDEDAIESQHVVNHLKPLKFSTSRSIQQMELAQKIEEFNTYTINFLDHNQNNILPKIKSLSKASRMLASPDQFKLFQKNHLVHGVYHSEIEDLQRKEQSYFHRLSISSKAQIKTRKNVFEMMGKKKSHSPCSLANAGNNSSICSVKVIQEANQSLNKKPVPIRQTLKPPNKLRSKTHDRWKLRDFYDPLVSDCLTDKTKHLAMLERQSFMKAIKNIEQNCQIIAAQNQTNKHIQIFGRFSEAADSKLTKKQRKLQKVKIVFGKSD